MSPIRFIFFLSPHLLADPHSVSLPVGKIAHPPPLSGARRHFCPKIHPGELSVQGSSVSAGIRGHPPVLRRVINRGYITGEAMEGDITFHCLGFLDLEQRSSSQVRTHSFCKILAPPSRAFRHAFTCSDSVPRLAMLRKSLI
ncbi:hypothetical protein AVEN_261680-1 [Araneus ventricosus]|uniref:Uncharacterized protein n=1 Tax=Araneus ventricosus TaxID=182803 RepID=A0A4Y2DUK4_ARAVE|nr:hypothetical protein AVEN_261680-1 [Araneus ventricosus]